MADINFFERVYAVVRQIPYGRVTSFGAIAKALGTARSARMVGWAMNASHNLDDVPAHRVLLTIKFKISIPFFGRQKYSFKKNQF